MEEYVVITFQHTEIMSNFYQNYYVNFTSSMVKGIIYKGKSQINSEKTPHQKNTKRRMFSNYLIIIIENTYLAWYMNRPMVYTHICIHMCNL